MYHNASKKQAFLRWFIQRQEKPLHGDKAFAITLGLLDGKSWCEKRKRFYSIALDLRDKIVLYIIVMYNSFVHPHKDLRK